METETVENSYFDRGKKVPRVSEGDEKQTKIF